MSKLAGQFSLTDRNKKRSAAVNALSDQLESKWKRLSNVDPTTDRVDRREIRNTSIGLKAVIWRDRRRYDKETSLNSAYSLLGAERNGGELIL